MSEIEENIESATVTTSKTKKPLRQKTDEDRKIGRLEHRQKIKELKLKKKKKGVEGWIHLYEEKGLLKKYKKRYYRLLDSYDDCFKVFNLYPNAEKPDKENIEVIPSLSIPLVDVTIEPLNGFKGKLHSFQINFSNIKHILAKKEVLSKVIFACSKSNEKTNLISILQKNLKESYSINYDEDQVFRIGNAIDTILNQFGRDNDIEKAVNYLQRLLNKYPYFLSLSYLVSEFYMKVGDVKKAAGVLEDLLIKDYTDKMDELPKSLKRIQYQVNYKLGTLFESLKDDADNIKIASDFFENCKKIDPDKLEIYYTLGVFYDKLKNWKEAHSNFYYLVTKKPDEVKYIICYVKVLKNMKMREELLYYLFELNKREVSIPLVYKELMEMVALKDLKKRFEKKYFFYNDFVPEHINLKFKGDLYLIYQNTVKKSIFSKNNHFIDNLVSLSTKETTQTLITILCKIDEEWHIKDKSFIDPYCDIIFKEFKRRSNSYDLLDLCVESFRNLENKLMIFRFALFLAGFKEQLNSKLNYQIYFTSLVKKFRAKKIGTLITVFRRLKDNRIISTLLSITRKEVDNALVDFRTRCCLSLFFFKDDQNVKFILKNLESFYSKEKKDDIKDVMALSLFKISSNSSYLTRLQQRVGVKFTGFVKKWIKDNLDDESKNLLKDRLM